MTVTAQKFISNDNLITIKEGWPGTPVDDKNRFINLEYPFLSRFSDVMKWMLSRNPQKAEKTADSYRLQPVNDTSFLNNDKDCIIWLGHATFFIRINGIKLLIDPVFFDVPLVKRYTPHVFSTAHIHSLDYLLISHDHQDHCQKKSISTITSSNENLEILTGLNMERLVRPWSNGHAIQMAGWFQQYQTRSRISIYYLPTRHWSKRGLRDDNLRLWGAFVIQSGVWCFVLRLASEIFPRPAACR